MKFLILIDTVPKEEETLEGVPPRIPSEQEVAAMAHDYLSEVRKDAGYGWMVSQVISAQETEF